MRFKHTAEVDRLLRDAGWHEARRIDVTPWELSASVPMPPVAREILREYGGLRIGEVGPGVEFSRNDVNLTAPPPYSEYPGDPELEASLDRVIGSDLFPLGTAHRENMELWVDGQGRIYMGADFHDGGLRYYAQDFGRALEMLLLGLRPPWPV